MDLLEKLYDGKINFKECVNFSQYKSELDMLSSCDITHKLANSLKTEEQKNLFKALEADFQRRIEQTKKQMFLNGLSCGMKMGIEMNNRFKDFDFDKNAPFDYNV